MLGLPTARPAASVAAVILNWNGWRDTLECLESVYASTRVPEHVVVCDNGSLDGSLEALVEWARQSGLPYALFSDPDEACDTAAPAPALIVIANRENRGFAAGSNVGIRYALRRCRADFVWMLNNDVAVDESALERMLRAARGDEHAAMVGSALLSYDAPHRVQAIGGGYILPVICHDTQLGAGGDIGRFGSAPVRLDHLIGASVLVRAAAIRDVGYMDESYFLYREETDWCIAMRRRGWHLLCAPDAIVWHKQSRSIGFKSPLHDYYAVRNALKLTRKFYPEFVFSAFAYYALRALVPKLARLQFARAGAVLRALRDFAYGVDGRAGHHTDDLLLRQYVAHDAEPAGRDTVGARNEPWPSALVDSAPPR